MKKTRKQIFTPKTLIPLLLISLALLISLSTVSANEIYVNTTGNDTSGTGTADNPYLTIQTGINNLDPDGTLKLAIGQYNGTGNTNITVNKNMIIMGESQAQTIINGTDTNWIFKIQPGISFILQNLTLTNGYAINGGGAIYNQGNLTVTNCIFTNNQATTGGAIFNNCFVHNGLGSVTCVVTESTFTNNHATYGGAIYNICYVVITGSGSLNCTINECTFTNNHATYGGAIYNDGSVNGLSGSATCTSIINESTFINNQATNGAAVYNQCTLVCDGSIATASCKSIINESTFINNTATNGGAIYNFCYVRSGSGSVNCTANFNRFYNNTATNGNAINNNGGIVDATLNWWGSNEDPSSQFYGSNIVYDPWIVLTINADPATIYNTRTSTITANLLYDSRSLTDPNNPAYYHAPELGCVPDTQVTFDADSLGDLTPGKPYTTIIPSGQNGKVIFTASNTGISDVNATVDNETVKTSITIINQIDDAYVATAADGGSDSNDGSSSYPFLTLEKAINAVIAGGRIHIANGVYNDDKDKQLIIDHDMTIFRDLWIAGTGNNVILDAGPPKNYMENIFNIETGVNVNICNLTFVNGTNVFSDKSFETGGAIVNRGNLTALNCNFTNNYGFSAGAIYNSGTMIITNCLFTNNTGLLAGAVSSSGNSTLINSTFTNNTALLVGAVYSSGNSTITNSTFTENTGQLYGGAFYSEGNSIITNSTFKSNTGVLCGAIYSAGNSTITNSRFTANIGQNYGAIITSGKSSITNSTFTANQGNIGGAILNVGITDLTNCSFTSNNATSGGAIFNIYGTLNMSICSFSANNATSNDTGPFVSIGINGDGGAICNLDGTINITDSKLTNNIATNRGGAICNFFYDLENNDVLSSSLILSSTILANNSALYGGAIYNNATTNITDSLFNGNNATIDGGAICNALNGTTNVTSTLFTDNVGVWGGAIQNYGQLFVSTVSIFTGNRADFGAAISNREGSNSTVTGCNFMDNTATSVGGAISNIVLTLGGSVNSTVLYCNIINNTAIFNGGAIFKDGKGDVQVHFNRILNNTDVTVFSNNPSTEGNCLNATNNWWGSNFDGGSNPLDAGRCNINVISDTWIILSVNANPSEINNGETSDITTDLNHNMNLNGEIGTTTDHIPDGTIQLDIHSWGNFNTGSITILNTINGAANTIYYANGGQPTPTSVTINGTADGYTTTGIASAILTIKKVANLTITKTAPDTVIAGTPITYTITIRNEGPDDAANVSFTDTFTSGATAFNTGKLHYMWRSNDDVNWIEGDWTDLVNPLTMNLGTILNGKNATIQINGTINSSTLQGTVLNNTATTNTTTAPGNKIANKLITVNTQTDVQLTKIVDNPRPDVGDTVTFTVTAHNNGPSDVLNIQIQDIMPVEFTNIIITPSKGDYDTGTGIWTLNLTNGETATLNLSGIVSSIMAGKNTTNTVTLVGTTNTTNATIYVPKSNLYIQITSNNNNPTVGQIFTLRYKLGNYGPDDALNVTITIPIPDGFVISKIEGDGTWTIVRNSIIWTMKNVTVGDPDLFVSGWTRWAGSFLFGASITSDTFNLNTQGVNSLSLNSAPQVEAATSKTVGMQSTGIPLVGIVLAILMVFGGFLGTRKP